MEGPGKQHVDSRCAGSLCACFASRCSLARLSRGSPRKELNVIRLKQDHVDSSSACARGERRAGAQQDDTQAVMLPPAHRAAAQQRRRSTVMVEIVYA